MIPAVVASIKLKGRRVYPSRQRLVIEGNSFCYDFGWNVAAACRATVFGQTFSSYDNVNNGSWGSPISALIADPMGAALVRDIQVSSAVVLVEITNTIGLGTDVSGALSWVSQWCSFVRQHQARAPIVICGTIPKYVSGGSADVAMNQALLDVDAAIAASPTTYGADAHAYLRSTGGPYAFGQTSENLGTASVYASSGAYADEYIHPTAEGGAYIGECIANALARLLV